MSVTAIPDRHHRQPVPQFAPSSSGRAEAVPAITVTLELAINGDRLPRSAVRLLRAIRELAAELGDDAVRVTGPIDTVEPLTASDAPPEHGDGTLYVYPDTRTAVRDGTVLRLTRLEFDLLLFLCEHPGRAFRRVELLRGVWGYDETSGRTVDVHIRRLRAKIGVHRPLVTTVHGVGYRLDRRARVSIVRAA